MSIYLLHDVVGFPSTTKGRWKWFFSFSVAYLGGDPTLFIPGVLYSCFGMAWVSAASVIHPDEAESLRGGRVACGSAVPGRQNRRHFLRAALSKAHLQKRAA